ncbi:MAG: SpoIID/LytB domain-containing protein, partial [Cyanobacteria bacterium REEB65]|nr:SpoIID/LytB domain-containing protein [Cyanobacteria bacterium REEB65]
ASCERPETNAAVDATRGELVTYDGRPIAAYYCSAAGGYTDGAETVWLTKPVPYLQPVPDFDQDAPSYTWQATRSTGTVKQDLARHGIQVGQPTAIEPMSRGYSGRVRILRVVGTKGDHEVSGEKFRYFTGLKSSLFNVAAIKDRGGHVLGFEFAGRGHGHGLGLSQWGARELGEMGYSYAQILQHYYPETELTERQAALPLK